MPGEHDGRERRRRVARLAIRLGDGDGGARQAVVELVDAVRRRVERRQHGRRRRLRPARLAVGAAEQGALLRETLQRRGGGALVPVGVEVVGTQRVALDEDDDVRSTARRRDRPAPHRGRAPERDGAGAVGRGGERQRDLRPGERRQVDGAPLPPVRGRHRVGEHDALTARALDRYPERDGAVLGSADRQVEERPLGQREPEPRGLGRPRDDGLAEHVAQPLPADARRHGGQDLPAEDEAHRLDGERGAGDVRGTDEKVAGARAGQRARHGERVGPRLVARRQGGLERPGNGDGPRRFRVQLDLGHGAQDHAHVGSGRDAQADLEGVELVRVLETRDPLQVQDREIRRAAADQASVADLQPGDARAGLPALHRGGGSVEAELRALHGSRGRRGAAAHHLPVEDVHQPRRARPRRGTAAGRSKAGEDEGGRGPDAAATGGNGRGRGSGRHGPSSRALSAPSP